MSNDKTAEMAVVPTGIGCSPGLRWDRRDRGNGQEELLPNQRDSLGAFLRQLDLGRSCHRRTGWTMDQTGQRKVLVFLTCVRYGCAVLAAVLVLLLVISLWMT